MRKEIEYTKRIARLKLIDERDKLKNMNEYSLTGLQYLQLIGIVKQTKPKPIDTILEKKSIITKSIRNKFLPSDGLNFSQYRNKIDTLSAKNDLTILPNYKKLGYELEHNISVWLGYHNNIDVRIISDIRNLSYMIQEHNAMKSYYSLITERNKFIIIENIIHDDFKNTFLEVGYDTTIEYGLIPHKYKKTYKIFYKLKPDLQQI
jgi:hypothetical protein